MKKSDGFTLIELLAVIIILGLLSVLIIPRVTSAITDSRKNVNESSVRVLLRIADNYFLEQKMRGNFQGCTYDFGSDSNTCDGLEFTGSKPESGSLNIDQNGNVSLAVQFDGLCYKKSFDSDDIVSSEYNSYDCVVPQLNG